MSVHLPSSWRHTACTSSLSLASPHSSSQRNTRPDVLLTPRYTHGDGGVGEQCMYTLYSMHTIYCIVSHSLKRTIIPIFFSLHVLMLMLLMIIVLLKPVVIGNILNIHLPLRIFWKCVFSSGTLCLEAPPTLSNMGAVLFLDSKYACHWTALSSERIFLVSSVSIFL